MSKIAKGSKQIYTENFVARVNRHEESATEEVILRGVDSAHTIVLRPEKKDQNKFGSGKNYQIAIAEMVETNVNQSENTEE